MNTTRHAEGRARQQRAAAAACFTDPSAAQRTREKHGAHGTKSMAHMVPIEESRHSLPLLCWWRESSTGVESSTLKVISLRGHLNILAW